MHFQEFKRCHPPGCHPRKNQAFSVSRGSRGTCDAQTYRNPSSLLWCGVEVAVSLLSQRIHHPSACHFAGFQYKLPPIPFAKTFRGTYRFRSQRHTGRTSHHAVAAVRVVVSVNCSNAQMQPKSGDFYTLSCFQRSSSSSKVYGKCGMFRTS